MKLSDEEITKVAQAKELCLEMNRLLRALVFPPLQPRTERDTQIGVPAGVIATAQAITEIFPEILELARRAQEERDNLSNDQSVFKKTVLQLRKSE